MPHKRAVGRALSTIILHITYTVQSNTTLATHHAHTVPKPAHTGLAHACRYSRIHVYWRPFQASRYVNGALGAHTMTSYHHCASPDPPVGFYTAPLLRDDVGSNKFAFSEHNIISRHASQKSSFACHQCSQYLYHVY